jgi:demethylmenaquinone methyltransferase/2-methoxy-6-polyprenyl-1,4-benzoquinol methylase
MTLEHYYRERAPDYDLFYAIPEFEPELTQLRAWLVERARGRTVLEIAAGTGHWTAVAAPVAKSITATDSSPAVLAIASRRDLGPHVSFVGADAYELAGIGRDFNAAMGHLWWSHVPIRRRRDCLQSWVSHLRPGSRLLMIDQNYVRGFSIPGCRQSESGDRYEWRSLADGSVHEILKNYPSDEELGEALDGFCDDVEIMRLHYFWAVSARTRSPAGPASP